MGLEINFLPFYQILLATDVGDCRHQNWDKKVSSSFLFARHIAICVRSRQLDVPLILDSDGPSFVETSPLA